MKLKYSTPTSPFSENARKMIEIFIEININLLYHVHNRTADEKEMWRLMESVNAKTMTLWDNKVVNLRDLMLLLSLTLPVSYRAGLLHKLNDQLSDLLEDKPFDLQGYTDTVLMLQANAVNMGQQLQRLQEISKARSERKSVLDELPCKTAILDVFEQISRIETSSSGRQSESAFADLYKAKLRPLLKETFLFNPQNTTGDENDPEWETEGQINHRVYKRMAKLYSGWKNKRLSMGDITYLIAYFEKNLWSSDASCDHLRKAATMKVSDADVDKMQKRLEEVQKYVATHSSTD